MWLYTGQSPWGRAGGSRQKAVFFFSFGLMYREGEGPPRIRTLTEDGQRRAFTPAVILFIALPAVQDKSDPDDPG